MARIDLDARRAEREGHTIVINGREVTIPGALALGVAEALTTGRYREGLRLLVPGLSDDELDTLTLDDVAAICEQCYGLTFPESDASSAASPTTGRPSTLTSLASTA